MKQKWIVDRFKDIFKTHIAAGKHSPFQKVGKFVIMQKDWSVGIDYGNGSIHNVTGTGLAHTGSNTP